MHIYSTKIVKIGNSQGIRIPKILLKQTRLDEDVELVAEDGKLYIRPVGNPRADWDNSFALMAAQGDDRLLDPDVIQHDWDDGDWEW